MGGTITVPSVTLHQLLEQNHSQCDYGGRDHNEFVPLQRHLRVTLGRLSSDVCHRSVPLTSLRQEVEVHEIHAESDYDEDDEGPVAPGSQDGSLSQLLISRNRKEPFENLPRLHPSAL